MICFIEDDNGNLFCENTCLVRFGMGKNDKCKNCNKKLFKSVLTARENNNNQNCCYFCSKNCFDTYCNKNPNNKLEFEGSVLGLYWPEI